MGKPFEFAHLLKMLWSSVGLEQPGNARRSPRDLGSITELTDRRRAHRMSSVAAGRSHERRNAIPRASGFAHRTERTLHRRGAHHHGAAGDAHHPGPGLLVAPSRRSVDHPARRTARQRPVHVHRREPSLDDARVAERGAVRDRVRRRWPRPHRARCSRAVTWLGLICDDAESTAAPSESRRARHRHAHRRRSRDSRSGDRACR